MILDGAGWLTEISKIIVLPDALRYLPVTDVADATKGMRQTMSNAMGIIVQDVNLCAVLNCMADVLMGMKWMGFINLLFCNIVL